MVWVHGLNAEKELCQVVEHSPGEGIVVLTTSILEIVVAFVVEHLIGGEVHCSVQQLVKRRVKTISDRDNILP